MLSLSTRAEARKRSREESHALVQTLVAMGLLCLTTLALLAAPVPTGKPGNYPAWWFSRNVIAQKNPTNASPAWPTNYPTSDDYSGINQGQLKNLATAAYNELVAQSPTNVWSTPQGTNLASMITGWNPTNGDSYAGVNLGQLKTVAKPFYDVLIGINYTSAYPWTGVGADDYSAANIGQAKYAFSFDVGYDSDGNHLPDWWELYYLGQTGNTATNQSPAGDGYTLAQEYTMGRNPDDYYQGVAPVLAIVSGNNQTNSAGAFVTNALVVSVKNASSVPLTNAPVVFWSTTGGGLATNTTTAPVSSYQLARTGTNGYAQIYFQQPLVANATNSVSVAAGTAANVTFSATTPADTAAPAAPTGVAAVAGPASGEVDLTWVNHADNATSLVVQQSTDGTTWTTAATLTHLTSTSYAITGGLTSGTPYSFRIEAVGGGGTTPSSPTSTTPPGTGAVPRYGLIDLGTNMSPAAMNSNCDMVGGTNLWSQGTNYNLSSGGFSNVVASGIDDSGHMVGSVPGTGGGAYGEVAYWADKTSAPSGLGTNVVLPGGSAPFGWQSGQACMGGDGSIVGEVGYFGDLIGNVAATFTPGGPPAWLWSPDPSIPLLPNNVFTTSKARGHWAGWYSSSSSGGAVVDGTEYPGQFANAVNDSGIAVGEDSSGNAAIIAGTGAGTTLGPGGYALALNNATVMSGTNTVAQPQIVGYDGSSGNPTLWDYTNPDGTTSTTYVAKNINTLLPATNGWTVGYVAAINNSSAIAGAAIYSGTDSAYVSGWNGALLLPAELAVDANRDGKVVLANDANNPANVDSHGNPLPVDTTSPAHPYRFWVNNDQDSGPGTYGSEVVPTNPSFIDSSSTHITSVRDLEDYTRLWIYMKGLNTAINSGAIKVGLKWKNTNGTSPGIQIHLATDSDGGLEYLNDTTYAAANAQAYDGGAIQSTGYGATITPTAGVVDFVFPTSVWTHLSDSAPKTFFLFDGISKGMGQLEIVFLKSDGVTKIGEGGSLWLDLHDIKEMYQRVICNPQPPYPYNFVSSAPADPTITPAIDNNGGTFTADPNEDTSNPTYIVFVHGFNMSYAGSTNYAETMFKRLWQRGYRGRFASFRWPTYGNGGSFLGFTYSGVGTYNDSEYIGWNSGTALKNFVHGLKTSGSGYTIDLFSHSMGSIVVGEALREGMSADVSHYAMSHAAASASCYDNSTSSYPNVYSYTTPDTAVIPYTTNPDTYTRGLAYTGWLGGIGGGIVNFYADGDGVIGDIWGANNWLMKPQPLLLGANGKYYYYPNNASGQKLVLTRLSSRYVTNAANASEAKAYVDQSLTSTIGSQTTLAGSVHANVPEHAMTTHGYEWDNPLQNPNVYSFYSTLMGKNVFNVNLIP